MHIHSHLLTLLFLSSLNSLKISIFKRYFWQQLRRDNWAFNKLHYMWDNERKERERAVGWTWKCITSKFYFLQKLNFTTKRSWNVALSRKWSVAIATISFTYIHRVLSKKIQRGGFFFLLHFYIINGRDGELQMTKSAFLCSLKWVNVLCILRGISLNFCKLTDSHMRLFRSCLCKKFAAHFMVVCERM